MEYRVVSVSPTGSSESEPKGIPLAEMANVLLKQEIQPIESVK
jgi:hypothetical protein